MNITVMGVASQLSNFKLRQSTGSTNRDIGVSPESRCCLDSPFPRCPGC